MLTTEPAWSTADPLHSLPPDFSGAPRGQLRNIPGELKYNLHVHLHGEPYTALAAPLTEIVVWTLREGAPRRNVEELLTALMAVVNAIPFAEGMYKAGWGPVLNDARKFVVMIGWSTMEVRSITLSLHQRSYTY